MARIHIYIDTSALVKRYVSEPGSDFVRALFRKPRTICIHFLDVCIPEAITVFHRKHRERAFPARLRDLYHQALLEDILKSNRIFVQHLSDRVVKFADEVIRKAFRGKWAAKKGDRVKPRAGPIDSLVISGAFRLDQALHKVVLVSADEDQCVLARQFRIEVCNPEKTQLSWIANRLRQRPGPK